MFGTSKPFSDFWNAEISENAPFAEFSMLYIISIYTCISTNCKAHYEACGKKCLKCNAKKLKREHHVIFPLLLTGLSCTCAHTQYVNIKGFCTMSRQSRKTFSTRLFRTQHSIAYLLRIELVAEQYNPLCTLLMQ